MKRILITLLIVSGWTTVFAQNRYEEVIAYQLTGGWITIPVKTAGHEGVFAIDVQQGASTAVTEVFAAKAGIPWEPVEVSAGSAASSAPAGSYPRSEMSLSGKARLERVLIGESTFVESLRASVIRSEELSEAGIDGILGLEAFTGTVLSLSDGVVIVSAPYKPSFVPLANRGEFRANRISVKAGEQTLSTAIDLSLPGLLYSSEPGNPDSPLTISVAGKSITADPTIQSAGLQARIGRSILEHGLLSFDPARNRFYFTLYTELEEPLPVTDTARSQKSADSVTPSEGIVALNTAKFLERIYNYREDNEFRFRGDRPAVIDYWAEWCGPCKRLIPIYESLSARYAGRVDFYKVNIDEEPEVKNHFRIHSIPMIMIIKPGDEQPYIINGIRSEAELAALLEQALAR